MFILVAVLFIVASSLGFAAGAMQWNVTFGGTDVDYVESVQQIIDGGYIVAGFTDSFGAGGYDMWLVKTNSSGGQQWNVTFGGTGADYALSVQQTTDAGYIVAGYTNSSGAGGYDIWLVKTNSSGGQQWNVTFGGSRDDGALSVQQTTDEGYIIAGETNSSGAGGYDIWLVKTNSSGGQQWNVTFGGTGADYALSVQQTTDQGYITAGSTNSSGAGDYDFWLVKVYNDSIINSCSVISLPGSYQLANNVTGAPINASESIPGGVACVKIAASNVIFDCNGYSITNNGTGGTSAGIILNGSLTNVTVKNCLAISNYTYGVYVLQSNNSVFTNNSAYNNSDTGFYINSGSSNNLTNNSAYNNNDDGFDLYYGSNNNIINNTAYNNTYGFYLSSSDSNAFVSNNATNNNLNGFYASNSSFNNYTGCRALASNSTINSAGFAFYAGSHNNTLTGNFASLDSNGFLVTDDSANNTLTGNLADGNSETGFSIWFSARENTISRCNATDSTIGFALSNSAMYNTLSQDRATGNNQTGFEIQAECDHNLIDASYASGGQYGFMVYASPNNNITNSNATSVSINGFWIFNGNGSVLASDFANNATDTAFSLDHSYGLVLTGDIANGSLYGFYLHEGGSHNLTSSNATHNLRDGFYLESSDGNTFLSDNGSFNGHNDSVYAFNGFVVSNSTGNLFEDSYATNNTHLGFYVTLSSDNVFNNSDVSRNGIGGFYSVLSGHNNYTYCRAHDNAAYGFYFNSSNWSIVSATNATHNAYDGFLLTDSYYNVFGAGTNASNNTDGFWLDRSRDNNITDSFAQENAEFDLYNNLMTGTSASFCNNIVSNLTGSGGRPVFYSDVPVSVSGLVLSELILCGAGGSSVTNTTMMGSDTLQNNGFIMIDTNDTNVSNSSSMGNYYGFFMTSSHGNRFTNDTAGDSDFGFISFVSENNLITHSTAYNNSAGMVLSGASNHNNLSFNNVSDALVGYLVESSDDNLVTDSNVSLTFAGVGELSSADCGFIRNDVSGSYYGFASLESGGSSFANNTIRSDIMGIGVETGHLDFSGNNSISVPLGTPVMYLTDGGALSTGDYDAITDNLTFGVSASNVSILVLNLSDMGISNTSISSISGVYGLNSSKVVQSAQGNYYGLLVFNESPSISFTPRLYYNSSDIIGYSIVDLGIGRYDSNWSYASSSVDQDLFSIIPHTSFLSGGFFAPLIYSIVHFPSSGHGTARKTPRLEAAFNCSDGSLEISATRSGAPIPGMLISLFHSDTVRDFASGQMTDENGVAAFTINTDGRYEVQSRLSGYMPETLDLGVLASCAPASETKPPVLPPLPVGVNVTNNTQETKNETVKPPENISKNETKPLPPVQPQPAQPKPSTPSTAPQSNATLPGAQPNVGGSLSAFIIPAIIILVLAGIAVAAYLMQKKGKGSRPKA